MVGASLSSDQLNVRFVLHENAADALVGDVEIRQRVLHRLQNTLLKQTV